MGGWPGWCGGSICSATSCKSRMNPPWESLGLRRFLVLDDGERICYENGEPQPLAICGDCPRVTCGKNDEETIDLELLARVLLPTLPDHTLGGLSARFALPEGKGERIVGLLAALIGEARIVSPQLVSVLGGLLPGATGEFLARLAPLADEAEPASPQRRERIAPPRVTATEALSRDGAVGTGLSAFEDRPGQLEMARLVERTFSAGGKLVVEAGPGTGKTFAYLVPALIHLRDHTGARVVVSTRTKQLQEQVYGKDIPFLTERIAPGVKSALLKGRENYLCLRQWERVFPDVTEGLDRDLRVPLAYLAGWLFRTETGDIEENHAFLGDPKWRELWPRLSDSPHRCPGPICPLYDDCFSVAARRRAREADLVVVNHSLLFADLKADRGILGDYDYLIVDEAHALEGAARDAFTSSLAPSTLDRFLWEIHHLRGRREGGWVARLPLPPGDPRLASLRENLGGLRAANLRLFVRLGEELPTEPRGFLPPLDPFLPQVERVINLLSRLRGEIEGVGETLADGSPEVGREAERLSGAVDGIAALYETLFSPPRDGYVHWYERRRAGEVTLYASPLEVNTVLAESLYPRVKGIVLTSATLSSGEGFSYIERALGLGASPGETRYAVVESPFAYREKMRVYLPRFLPPVDGDGDAYAAVLSDLIERLAPLQRKVLVLFTSYRLLNAVHSRVQGTVLAQGIDGPRGKLIEQFKGVGGGAVLLGTDSFWEGVDLPGKDLEILIITRLPFPVPTDPVFAALGARLAAAGRDPFHELSLPQAILKLRQGVGRLIRTQSDRGAVIITDRRILEKGYGKRFRAALPVGYEEPTTLNRLVEDLERWFAHGD